MRLEDWQATAVMLAVLVALYGLMCKGWRRRGRKHDLPPLLPPPEADPADATLADRARYFGTTVAGDWLDRVVARGLGTRSGCRLSLSAAGLDVHRPDGSFRVTAPALRGARHDQGIAGKVVPPHGLLVVTWRHGDLTLDTGFRLEDPAAHDAWVSAISTMAKENTR